MAARRALIPLSLLLLLAACAAPGTTPVDLARLPYEAGVKAFERGDFDASIQHFTEAIEIHPDHADAFFRRGSARMRMIAAGEIASEHAGLEKAEADLTSALRMIPVHYEALYNRGLVRAALARYREAAEDLQNALLSPDHALRREAHAKLAQLLDEKFEDLQPQAARHYEKYFEMGGADPALRERYDRLRSADSPAKAVAVAEELFAQAMRENESGDRTRALRTLEQAIQTGALAAERREFAASVFAQWTLQEQNEASAGALLREAQALLKEGSPERKELARRILERAKERYPASRAVQNEVTPLLKTLEARSK